MKKIKAILLIIFILPLTFACNDGEEDSTVVGDAIIISKKLNGQSVYAYAFYAYAYNAMKTVEVKGIANTDILQLGLSGPLTNNYFFKEPEDTEFSTNKPAPDTFTFNATFENGNTSVGQDIVTSDVLEPVTIEKCVYNTEKSYAEFGWTALANADAYSITLLDDTKEPVFSSAAFTTTKTSVYLESGSSGWKTGHPVAGKTYTVLFYAHKYENSDSPNLYHMQSTSYSEGTLVWGQ
jgi:hypothetical protein